MIRKRLAVLTVSALMLGGAGLATPLLLGGGVASASSGNHKATLANLGTDVEGKAKVKFVCSAVSGIYNLTATNLNVVDGTGTSAISKGAVLNFFTESSVTELPLTQNSWGLWGVTAGGIMPLGDCQSGQQVGLLDSNSTGQDRVHRNSLIVHRDGRTRLTWLRLGTGVRLGPRFAGVLSRLLPDGSLLPPPDAENLAEAVNISPGTRINDPAGG